MTGLLQWIFEVGFLTRSLAGQLVLGAAAAAFLAVAAAHIAISRSSSRLGVALALAPLVLVPAAIGAAGKLAWAAREARLDALVTGDFPRDQLAAELAWLLVATSLAMVLVPVTGAAFVRAAQERALRWLAAGATGLTTAAAGTACAYMLGFLSELEASANYGPGELELPIRALDDTLASGAVVIVLFAVITAGAVLYRRARDGRALFSNAGLVLSLITCLAGVGAFAATRDHAWDRQHPKRLSYRWLFGEHRLEPIAGMRLSSCTDLQIAPVLRVEDGGRVTLDSRLMSDIDQLGADLETLRRNWLLLHPRDPFSGRIILWAEPDTPLVSVAPFLERARAAGYVQLFIHAYAAVPVSTRTLGLVQVARACPQRVDLESGTAPLPETVEGLAHEIQDGRTTLALPP